MNLVHIQSAISGAIQNFNSSSSRVCWLDFVPPFNYHLFCSPAHFLKRGRTFDSLEVVENGCRQPFLPSNLLSDIVAELHNWDNGGLK